MNTQTSFQKAGKFSFIVFVISLIVNFLFFLYQKATGTGFYFHGMTSYIIHLLLCVLSVLFGITAMVSYSEQKSIEHKAIAAILSFVIIISSFFVLAMSLFFVKHKAFHQIKSPDGRNSIVLTIEGGIYRRENSFFIKEVRGIRYSDRETPPLES